MFKSFFLNKNNFLILIILILAFFLRYYNFDKYGYWMDEYWGTFYLSNPELSFYELQNRVEDFGKFQFGMPEPTPIYYYYLLNIFFEIFGYNPENGRIFSILFSFTSLIFFFFTFKLITTKFNSIISLVLISLNIFLIWEAQEARVQSLNLFFVSVNLYLFCFLYFKKLNFLISIFYILSNIVMLSVHPLTAPIILANSIFLITKRNESSVNILLQIFVSGIIYIFLNFDYIFDRINVDEYIHHSKLSLSFFYSYHFKTFFGNIYFGALNLFLILVLILLLRFELIKNKNIFYLTILIITTYFSLLFISLVFQPVMHPRYKIYVVPMILAWIIISMDYLEFKKKNIIIFFYVFLTIGNYFIFYDDRHIKKPNVNKPLKIILNSDIKKMYLINYVHGGHYKEYFKKKKIVSKSVIEILDKNNIDQTEFWVLCVDDVASFSLEQISEYRSRFDCFPKFLNKGNYKNLNFNKFERTRLNFYVKK
ncbi:hypothetical protein [Candidatus Pelagibacter sp. HIMB1611]|uniref:hypothetical protein n=1 Tax=unclassified Candidatus Pelagibacter TaxID=2647897 RepID=UPI003F87881E